MGDLEVPAIDTSIFLTQDKFFYVVEEFVWMEDISYIEATIKACDQFMIEIEDVHKLKLINPILKDKLRMEGTNDGFLKREAQLPI
jgi:hypothetical protein